MRAYVFTDKALARHAGRFVWLSIDTENAANAPFKMKYPVDAVPTFIIINPNSGLATYRYLGGATVAQLEKILDTAEKEYRGRTRGADTLLADADRLYAQRDYAKASEAYKKAFKSVPPSSPRFGPANEAYVFALSSSDQSDECARVAMDTYPHLKNSPSAINVAGTGLGCALAIDAKNPKRASIVATLERYAREAIANPKVKVAADDRSGLYSTLVDAREDANDEEGAKKTAAEWASFLEKEAAKAKTADARAVFDSHRLGAYLALGTPEKAVPMLQASERDLPNDYNPPARLAIIYNAMKRYDDAIAASDRALKLVYGPRKLTVLRTRADIYEAMGNKAAAKKTIEDAIDFATNLPSGQKSERTVALLRKRLETLQ